MDQTQQIPSTTSHSQPSTQEFVTIKVVVPSSSVSKTVRLPVKIKVKELHDILTKKLATLANAPNHVYEDYGFYWHSESGPVWLSESSTLRAYNFKSNVSIEFKKRKAASPLGKSSATKHKGKKEKKKIPPPESATTKQEALQHEKDKEKGQHGEPPTSPRVAAVRKMSTWVSSRPGSLYDQKKEKEHQKKNEMKKERSQSVNILPRKDPEATLGVNAARFTSPSFSSTFDGSSSDTSPPLSPRYDQSQDSPRLGAPPSPLSSSPHNAASLNDLDDLIDIFDDLTEEHFNGNLDDEINEEHLLEEYVASIDHEDIEGIDTKLSDTELSPRFTYASTSPCDTPPLPNNNGFYNTRPRSYSSPRDLPFSVPHHSVHSTPATPDDLLPGEDRKMPGLRGASTKKEVGPSNASVRLGAVTSILEDALDGIESGSVDMMMMKHYVTSALCILRTMT